MTEELNAPLLLAADDQQHEHECWPGFLRWLRSFMWYVRTTFTPSSNLEWLDTLQWCEDCIKICDKVSCVVRAARGGGLMCRDPPVLHGWRSLR